MNYELLTKISEKTGKPWYAVIFTVGKYKSDMIFIDEMKYDYLLANLEIES